MLHFSYCLCVNEWSRSFKQKKDENDFGSCLLCLYIVHGMYKIVGNAYNTCIHIVSRSRLVRMSELYGL